MSALLSSILVVAIAADLAPLQNELASAIHRNEPKLQIRFVVGASAMLAQQIEHGAPYDVFLSANKEYVDRLASFRKIYGVGHPAIAWKDGKRHALNDLRADWVRTVAVPNPKLAPYGAAVVEALKRAGLWEAVEKKAVYGENVRQTLQIFSSGNTDAVLTSATLLPEGVRLEIDVVQEAGAITDKPESRRFVELLGSPEVQKVFRAHGLDAPK